MNNRVVKLSTSGKYNDIDLQENFNESVVQSIDADYYEVVKCQRLYNIHPSLRMLVDEMGLYKDDKQLNLLASYLYGADIHHGVIVGDVIFAQEVVTPEGPDLDGLDEEVRKRLEKALKRLSNRFQESLIKSRLNEC